MKKIILFFCVSTTIFIAAQNINGRFSSSLYTLQRFNSEISSEN